MIQEKSIMNLEIIPNRDGKLQLSPISIKEDYRKKWNIHEKDFVCLTKNGELISSSLYRVGGFGFNLKDDYFMLLKYVEDFYSKEIMRICENKDPKHLDGRWCILDKNGVEKIVFKDSFHSPYLVKNSIIYSTGSNYYNIETEEFYCYASSTMESTDYLFLDNKYDKDENKRGIMKINKKTGIYELIK